MILLTLTDFVGAPRFGLLEAEARRTIDELKGVVRDGWEAEVRRQGGTQQDCDAIRSAFVHEGFEYPTSEEQV